MNTVTTAVTGALTGIGLIVAIGPQNVMVLRTGVARIHVTSVVAVCAIADIVLIIAGVAGLGALVSGHPVIVVAATVIGGGYVIILGLAAARRVVSPAAMTMDRYTESTRAVAVGSALTVTLGNPHVYVDTLVMLGAVANTHGASGRWAFAFGACAASVVWFCSLGFGASRLAPVFVRPRSWQILDALVAVVMVGCGIALLLTLNGR